MEKTFLASGIIITVFAAFAFSQHKPASPRNNKPVQPAEIAYTSDKKDTVPTRVNNNESKYSISTSMDGRQYRIVEVNGKVTELYVDNVRIPDDKIGDYSTVIIKLQEKIKADKEKQEAAIDAQKKAIEIQAEVMKSKQLAMKDMIDKQANINKEMMQQKAIEMKALAEKQEGLIEIKDTIMKDQAEKIEKMIEQSKQFADIAVENDVLLKEEAVKQAYLSKQQVIVIKDQAEKLQKIIKEQNNKQVEIKAEDLKKQVEELKEQNMQLKEQLNQKMDSLYIFKKVPPGA